jgi:transposase-like protein
MTRQEIYKRFPTEKDCILHLEAIRWRGKATCPYCKSQKVTPMLPEQRYHCNTCRTSFSVTVRTIFHHTHVNLQTWFLAIFLIFVDKKILSSRQLANNLQVTKDTAWSMQRRIRDAMVEDEELLSGIVLMEETYMNKNTNISN